MELEHYLNLLCVEASLARLLLHPSASRHRLSQGSLHSTGCTIPQFWKAQSDMLPPTQSSREAKREPGG